MTWIFPTIVRTMSRGYNPDPVNPHLGVDFAPIAVGTPVVASEGGIITYVGNEGPDIPGVGGFGNVVVITHPTDTGKGQWRSLYAHLSHVGILTGVTVGQGVQIGLSGGQAGAPGAGGSDGPHLHFQIMDGGGNNSTNTVDPMLYLEDNDMTPEQAAQLAAIDKRTSVDIANVLNDPGNGVIARLGRVEAKLSAPPSTSGGVGLTEEQVRAIVRAELDKTKLAH